jgi:hypothetical protein
MTVISTEGVYNAAFKFIPQGTKMTVFTRVPGNARTNEVAVLRKEPKEVDSGNWGDWEVLSRPKTADPSLLPETWSEHPGIISTRTLADTFQANPDLWAEVHD